MYMQKKIVFMNVQIFLSKIQVFFQAFSTTTIFFRLKVIKYMYCMWSTNAGTKLFPWRVGKIENTKKFHLWSTCCSFQKTQDFLPFFQVPDFFQVWKIAGPISRIFQELKTLYEPWLYNLKLLNTNVFKFCFRPPFEQSLFLSSWSRRRKAGSSCIASNLRGRRSPNFWTSQSCYLSSNWFFLVRASIYW